MQTEWFACKLHGGHIADVDMHTPGPQFLKTRRAKLVLEGLSLERWAEQKGVERQNLTKAILGEWTGPKANQIVAEAANYIVDDRCGDVGWLAQTGCVRDGSYRFDAG